MATCPQCYVELHISCYIRNETYKSCPNCSKELGRHVYYPVAYFGERHHDDGTPFIQSYCPPCRGRSGQLGDPQLRVFCP